MKRSVTIASVVAAVMLTAPMAAVADVPTRTAAAPVDCPATGPGTAGGSGPGEPGTGGDEKPADEKPADEKPADEKPAEEEPAGNDTSGGEQKPDDSSASEGGAAAAPKSATPKPADDKPADDKPTDDKPADDKPADEKPADEKPAPAAPADCAAPAPGAASPAAGAVGAGAETSAGVINNWGKPNRVDEFDKDLSGWSAYDGEGHAGNGRRSPEAASVKDGLLTINGDSEGTTAGLAWNPGQKYGRWEGRVKAPVSDPSYNALLLLWPDAENFPVGGEVDFMEMTDHTRKSTELFLHYGEDNSQVQGEVEVDATQWHNWAVEWTPDHVTAFLDGKPWWTTTDTSILPPGPMHLCIQLDWFPKGEGEVKPSQMQVDWVKQYSIPESEQAEDNSEGLPGPLGGLTRGAEGAPDPGQTGAGQRGPSGV